VINLNVLLKEMVTLRASDLHLKVGAPPVFRIDGEMRRSDISQLREEDLLALASQALSEEQLKILGDDLGIDFAIMVPGVARFRGNIHTQRGTLAMTFRCVPMVVPTLAELNMPPVLEDIAMKKRGLVLVTGTVGSGKSTSLAAMINLINEKTNSKVITIEDPIEYLHQDKMGFMVQREVGDDTPTYASALRHVLRQDPNVILIGEIRDEETMSVALTAANTGHLVFSTLHTIDAVQTVNRVISFYPPHQHQEIRFLLASSLQAIISQRLVKMAGTEGRIPAAEILVCTAAIKDYIIDPAKTPLIRTAIQEGFTEYGMQTFDQSMMRLYKAEKITFEEALAQATNPSEFDLRARGIEATSDKTWDIFEGKASPVMGSADEKE